MLQRHAAVFFFGGGGRSITVKDRCSKEAKDGERVEEVWCRSAGQLTFLCSATIRRRVQSGITSLHERLALSRIKEESARVGRGEMSS